eukprot:8489378-Lingulodinium_polyedra.AAC.2
MRFQGELRKQPTAPKRAWDFVQELCKKTFTTESILTFACTPKSEMEKEFWAEGQGKLELSVSGGMVNITPLYQHVPSFEGAFKRTAAVLAV